MRLTQKKLKRLLSYDPATGIFRWKVRTSRRMWVGDIAGAPHGRGYEVICVDYKSYLSHRLAWFYVYGRWPKDQIDHVNGRRTDNRLANLREATGLQNQQNSHKLHTDNTSGYRGVSLAKKVGMWRANIRVNKRQKYLGCFDSPVEAHHAYLAAKRVLHPFAYHERELK